MIKMVLSTLGLIVLLGQTTLTYADSNSVGIVRSVSDEAYILRNGIEIQAAINTKIMNEDVLKTGPAGSLGVVFEDDTIVSMGPDSEVVVENFLFNPAEKKLSFIVRMIRGTFSFVSGQITKLAPGAVILKTPDATVGLRGTHVLVQVEGGS